MLLAVDIGNTNIVLGAYEGETLLASWRTATAVHRMPDEYAMLVNSFFTYRGLKMTDVDSAVISSTVPPLSTTFEELCERYLGVRALVVGPGIKTGIRVLYENPRDVGPDRIANAIAVHHFYGGPAIVVDFGTGTTFDAVSAEGDYLGGAIAPGITIAAEALFQRAARLYRTELVAPKAAIGRTTIASMQSGIIFGYVGLVEGIVARFQQEMGPARVIGTGGLAEVVARETKVIEKVDQALTLEGLRLIHELNR
jgi:type III pantothenate kinase